MKKSLRFMLVAACLLMLFTGCTDSTSTTPEHGNDNHISANSDPETGGCIRVHSSSDPDALHAYAATTGSANYVKELIFQYLYDFDPETAEMVPVLAKDRAIISDDGLAFTFEIREEAVWDNNNEPITGEDYAFSVKAMLNPISESPHIRGYYSFIKEVQVDPNNKKRFTVLTDEPFFLSEYAVAGFEIVSKKFYDPKGYLDNITIPQILDAETISNNPDLIAFNTDFHSERNKRQPDGVYGSGPYKLDNWTTGSSITLSRKKDWWGYKTGIKSWPFEAYADKIIFKTIPDRSSALQAAAAGEIDVMRDVPGEEFTKFRNDSSNSISRQFNLHTPDSYTYVYIGLNSCPPAGRSPVLKERAVRRALAHLTNVKRIIKSVYNDYGSAIVGPISPHNTNEYNTTLQPIPFDIEKAKSLLEEAGWVDKDGDGVREKMIQGKNTPLEIKFMLPSSSLTAP
ncbi:MAG TPA: hypothetical protein ENJ82_15510, partial [Bacteroidetes bacterium]|nr:hypothetical protein [Bacteroidota bacterium]